MLINTIKTFVKNDEKYSKKLAPNKKMLSKC